MSISTWPEKLFDPKIEIYTQLYDYRVLFDVTRGWKVLCRYKIRSYTRILLTFTMSSTKKFQYALSCELKWCATTWQVFLVCFSSIYSLLRCFFSSLICDFSKILVIVNFLKSSFSHKIGELLHYLYLLWVVRIRDF